MLSHHHVWSAVVHTLISSCPHAGQQLSARRSATVHTCCLFTCRRGNAAGCVLLSGLLVFLRVLDINIYGAFGACPKCWWKFLSVLSELHSVHDDIAKSTDHLDHSHDENKLFFRQLTGYSSPLFFLFF